jgi:hypothetical protein
VDSKYSIDPPLEYLKRNKELHERYEAGETQRALAAEFGISESRVAQLRYRWRRQLLRYEKYIRATS